jgi:hypothetical protein
VTPVRACDIANGPSGRLADPMTNNGGASRANQLWQFAEEALLDSSKAQAETEKRVLLDFARRCASAALQIEGSGELASKSSLPLLERSNCAQKINASERRPEYVGEIEFAVGTLPEQEAG